MNSSRYRLRTLVTGFALFVAVATSVLIPIGYFINAYSEVAHQLEFSARLKGNRLAKYIYSHRQLWQYQTARLGELIEVPEADEIGQRTRVTNEIGKLVMETGEAPAFPAIARNAPILVSGLEIGRIESASSFRQALIGTGYVTLFSGLLGFGMFFALRVLPLRVIDSTLAALGATQDELRNAVVAAEASNQAKSSFLANMSHEIRTPLNGILGVAQILANEQLSAFQVASAHTILESGRTLMALLNDVLDLSKIEAGKLSIEQTDGNLRNTFVHVQKLFMGQAQEKSIALNVEVADSAPDEVKFDQIRVRQCVSNMVSNAIKFTNTGSVIVSVDCEYTSDGDYLIRVDVTDTGIGISKEVRGRLFAEFSQADASTTREQGGTGLGLAITRKLARLMGGDTTVASTPGAGSTFTLTFRASPSSPNKSVAPALQEHQGSATLQGLRVLLVDDNAINRSVARLLLAPIGIIFTEATNGREALERLAKELFDLVLLDIHMPVMDGIEAIKHIRRSDTAWRNIPVIALTADAMSGDRERLLSIGMSGYVSKPIEQAVLVNEIQRVIGLSSFRTSTLDTLHEQSLAFQQKMTG
jgi:signal transduction histidine kinase/FixJ family two-component response regulator